MGFDTHKEVIGMKRLLIALLIAALTSGLWAMVLAEEANLNGIWANADYEQVEALIGVGLGVPEGAENVSYAILEGGSVAEVSFTWYGLEYFARVKPAGAPEDISGLTLEWDQTIPFEVGGREGTSSRAKTGSEEVELCQWYDAENALTYCVVTSDKDLWGFDITAAAEAVYAPALATE